MVRILFSLVAALSVMLCASGGALAGNYHYQETLICYDCHTMHGSDTQGFSSSDPYNDGRGIYLEVIDGTANKYLLKRDGVNNTCLGCHDGQSFAPDVFQDNTNSYVRQAGALNRIGSSEPYGEYTGHTLDYDGPVPGGVGSRHLKCISCHYQHGTSSYRNVGNETTPDILSYENSNGGSYATRDKDKEVWQVWDASWEPGTHLAEKFSYDSVRFNEHVTEQLGGLIEYNSRYAADLCGSCHASFHGEPGTSNVGGTSVGGGGVEPVPYEKFRRHPVYSVNIGGTSTALGGGDFHSKLESYNAATARLHVLSNADADYLDPSSTFILDDGLSPSCFTCHKAHGNQNPFGLIFMDKTAPAANISEQGAGSTDPEVGLKNLCTNCHTAPTF